jgi:hypothetical protein
VARSSAGKSLGRLDDPQPIMDGNVNTAGIAPNSLIISRRELMVRLLNFRFNQDTHPESQIQSENIQNLLYQLAAV